MDNKLDAYVIDYGYLYAPDDGDRHIRTAAFWLRDGVIAAVAMTDVMDRRFY